MKKIVVYYQTGVWNVVTDDDFYTVDEGDSDYKTIEALKHLFGIKEEDA